MNALKRTFSWTQVILILGALVLLTAAYFFDSWQVALHNYVLSLEQPGSHLIPLWLWSEPIAGLFFGIAWLTLFLMIAKQPHFVTSLFLFIPGLFVVVYPAMRYSGLFSFMFPTNSLHWNGEMFFYSGAFAAAIGVVGFVKSVRREKREEGKRFTA